MSSDRIARLLPESARGLARRIRFSLQNRGFKERVVQKQIGGVSFPFLLGDRCGEDWYLKVNDLSPEHLFLRSMIRPGEVVLDCGTHHGFLTILLANWAGQEGRVLGFEASPSSAEIAGRNIAMNGLEGRVTIERKAVGARAGTIRITNESNAIAILGRSPGGTEIPCVPLNDYAGLRPTMVKLDVEGLELDVLSGASEILKQNPRWAIEVHVEFLRRFGRDPDEIFDFISPSAYDLWLQKGSGNTPQPYDGQRLAELKMDQVHLYAIPKAR